MIYPTEKQLDLFKKTPGAFSVHEMIAAINVTSKAPDGTFCELGSHRGKSSIATAIGMSVAHGNVLHLVDPLYDMSNLEAWKHACQGHPDNAWCGAKEPGFNGSVVNLVSHATDGQIVAELHGDFSTHAIPDLHGKHGDFAYVFIDTDIHAYPLLKEETDLLWNRVKVGGIISFHDFGGPCTAVEQRYREMLQGGTFIEMSIDWEEIKRWVSEHGGETGNDSWHVNTEAAPCYFAALMKVK